MPSFVLIASLDAPTAGVFTFTGLSLGSYKRVRITIDGATVVSDDIELSIQFSIGGSFITAGYNFVVNAESSSDTNNPDAGTGLTSAHLSGNDANWSMGSANEKSGASIVDISNPGSSSLHKFIQYRTAGLGATVNCIYSSGASLLKNAGAIDGFKILGNGANMGAAKVRILGYT